MNFILFLFVSHFWQIFFVFESLTPTHLIMVLSTGVLTPVFRYFRFDEYNFDNRCVSF